MNIKQVLILVIALIVIALVTWHYLPLEFPWMFNAMMLLWKLAIVLAVAIVGFILAKGKKNQA